jgi:hypothetical protein
MEMLIRRLLPALSAAVTGTGTVHASEGGTSHVIPGATGTLSDFPGTAPAGFVRLLYLDYSGSISTQVPTSAGLTTDLEVESQSLAVVAGMTLEKTVLGGAHYSFGAVIPYSDLEISGNVQLPGGGSVSRGNATAGLGDITLLPLLLAWKDGSWQFNAMLPVYAPTGSYQAGRLGNTGLNYWTFDPTVGAVYSAKNGFNAMLHAGYAVNTENTDTDYRSGSILHFDGAVQQILPVAKGFLTVGVELFYFKQITGDSGDGAILGDFKGKTAGLGPVIGYIKPLDKDVLVFDLKWLKETDTEKRLEGDYLWFKLTYKF